MKVKSFSVYQSTKPQTKQSMKVSRKSKTTVGLLI